MHVAPMLMRQCSTFQELCMASIGGVILPIERCEVSTHACVSGTQHSQLRLLTTFRLNTYSWSNTGTWQAV